MTFGQGIIYQHERAPTGVEEGASEELPASDAAAETAAVLNSVVWLVCTMHGRNRKNYCSVSLKKIDVGTY